MTLVPFFGTGASLWARLGIRFRGGRLNPI